MNNQNTSLPQFSNLSKSFAQRKNNPHLRIFLKVDKIVSAPNALTVAYGHDIMTQQYIGIRLNTVDEYASDLMNENPRLKQADAQQKARQSYTGSHSRESLNDKRDKRKARFLSFDRCIPIAPNNNIPMFRSHWSELISNNNNCEIFEGMAYLHVKAAQYNNEGVMVKRDIAHLNIIQQIKTLNLGDYDENIKTLTSALATSFKNGMRRTGYAIFEIIDVPNNQILAETYVFQKVIKEVLFNPSSGVEYNSSQPAEVEDSIAEFMTKQHEGDITPYAVERDFLRVLMPLFFNIPVDHDALCQRSKEYLDTLATINRRAANGEILLRIACIHQVFIGSERKNLLINNIEKGLIKAYTHTSTVNGEQITIRRYIPTLFALHFHTDSQNPYVAFNIISNNPQNIPPTPLHAIPNDVFNIKYRKLV